MLSMRWCLLTAKLAGKCRTETLLLSNWPLRFSMSVKRRDLIRHMEQHGFYLVREGANHAIYTNGTKVIPVKRHRQLDRITANELCKQAGIKPKF
ncbi:type II toxin-antitoxin system HicA family toxin [Desulfosarcina ovata]|uniref:type II toxin-antitoxin system HicA family toxin n=1 Tax=Desulfosarcina ovata TaxID=83564 RepID=UPI002F3F6A90